MTYGLLVKALLCANLQKSSVSLLAKCMLLQLPGCHALNAYHRLLTHLNQAPATCPCLSLSPPPPFLACMLEHLPLPL